MARRDAFAGYHPCVNFIFYALVLVFSMCLIIPHIAAKVFEQWRILPLLHQYALPGGKKVYPALLYWDARQLLKGALIEP